MSETDPVTPAEPQKRGLLRGWRGWVSGAVLLVVTVVAGLIIWQLLPPLPIFTTTGQVYVESPEVYTRERLVNDRYRQDFWLRSQLDVLDRTDSLISAIESSRLNVGSASQGTREAPVELPKVEELAIAFREQFLLRAAMRDKIRQFMLENLLDDRHDLTGNSLYGLKFDTGVVPGTNTRSRAYVIIKLVLDEIHPEAVDKLLDSEGFIGEQAAGDEADSFGTAERQFESWERNLEARLNRFVNERWTRRWGREDRDRPVCEDESDLVAKLDDALTDPSERQPVATAPASTLRVGAPQRRPTARRPGEQRRYSQIVRRSRSGQVVREAIANVLGVNVGGVALQWPDPQKDELSRQNTLPSPWNRYFKLVINEHPDDLRTNMFGAPFALDLEPFTFEIVVVDLEDWVAFRDAPREQPFPWWPVRNFRVGGAPLDPREPGRSPPTSEAERPRDLVLLVPTNAAPGGQQGSEGPSSTPQAEGVAFARSLGSDDLRRVVTWAGAPECMVRPPVEEFGSCLLEGSHLAMNAPLYDFVRARKRSDSYAYAVFPRGDVEGILTDRSQTAETPSVPGGETVAAISAAVRRLEARAEPIVVNLARHYPDKSIVEFGWIIAKAGQQGPRQLSQLVLVSVPAHLDELELQIETGWLDRDSEPIDPGAPTPVHVSLPPDFEALDRVVVGGSLSEGPVINQYHFEEGCRPVTAVRACQPAEILIPGARLWRSTTVTLGGQTANRITVTPDMRGIIASFDKISWPPDLDREGISFAPLVVWTSEGSDRLADEVRVLPPTDPNLGVDCETSAAPGAEEGIEAAGGAGPSVDANSAQIETAAE